MAGLVLGLNPQPLEAGVIKAKSALDTVVEAARKTEAALKKTGDGGSDLKRKFDPAYAAALKLGNELDDLDRALKVGAINAQQYGAAIGRLGGATNNVGGLLGRFKSQFQNVGYQVADFATQVGAGTSATQALGQQLPQLLGGLGKWGAIMGAVAAIGIPLAAALYNSAGGAKDLGTATTEAADAIDAFREAVANANISADELKAKFGEASEEVKRAYDIIANLNAEKAQRSIDGLGASLAALWGSGGGGDARSGVADFFDANIFMAFTDAGREAMASARELTAEFVNQQSALANSNGDLDAQLAILTEMVQTANALAMADGSVSEAEQLLVDQIQTALELVTEQVKITHQVEAATWSIEGAANAAAAAMAGIGSAASGAYGAVAALASKAWEAANAKVAAAQDNTYAIRERQNAGMKGRGQPADSYALPSNWNKPAAVSGGGGGSAGSGGGESAVDKATKAYNNLKAAMDPAERSAQDLAKAQATINEALKLGVINTNEAAKAMAMAQEKYAQAGSMWQDFQSAGGNALDAMIDGTMNLKDALKDMIKELVLAIAKKRLLASVEGGSSSDSLGGLIFKGLTGGFAGMFDAGGTIDMGKTGIVGEYGPERVRATPSGAVVTSRVNTARQMGGGGVARVVVEGGDLVLNDNGTISARIRVMGQQAVGTALGQVKASLPGWSTQMRTDGVVT